MCVVYVKCVCLVVYICVCVYVCRGIGNIPLFAPTCPEALNSTHCRNNNKRHCKALAHAEGIHQVPFRNRKILSSQFSF